MQKLKDERSRSHLIRHTGLQSPNVRMPRLLSAAFTTFSPKEMTGQRLQLHGLHWCDHCTWSANPLVTYDVSDFGCAITNHAHIYILTLHFISTSDFVFTHFTDGTVFAISSPNYATSVQVRRNIQITAIQVILQMTPFTWAVQKIATKADKCPFQFANFMLHNI